MTENELLRKVKDAMSIGANNHLDDTLKVYMQACKVYMKKAGVSDATLASDDCVPVIAIGTKNLYKDGVFSEFFYQSVIQLVEYKNE